MSKVSRKFALRGAAWLLATLAAQSDALAATPARRDSAAAAKPAAPHAELLQLAQQVAERGRDSTLPPHLSKMLGLNDGAKTTPVRQLVVRVGTLVHDFNVVSADHQHGVLFTSDESTQVTRAYALRHDGSLRLALEYVGNGVGTPMAQAAGRAGYQREVQFWSQYVRALPAARPAPAPAPVVRPAVPPAAPPPPRDATTHP